MKYDIEVDWMLTATCNYRCDYCFFPPSILQSKIDTSISPSQWTEAFDATDLTWLIHLTGGEPSVLPGFVELCAGLTRRHLLSLNSNLSHAALRDFAERIDPARVAYINAAFHPAERQRRRGFADFFDHADLLRSRGFRVMVTYVATPAMLAQAETLSRLLAGHGWVPVPKLMRGGLDGRLYPRDYTPAERQVFRRASAAARAAYAPMLDTMAERPSIDPFLDDRYLEGVPVYFGKTCGSGQRFVRLQPNGDVFRCPNVLMGNLLSRSFTPAAGPTVCGSTYCFYFCEKYTRGDQLAASPHALRRTDIAARAADPRCDARQP